MPRIKKFGSIKKKVIKENLGKARRTRSLKMRMAEINKMEAPEIQELLKSLDGKHSDASPEMARECWGVLKQDIRRHNSYKTYTVPKVGSGMCLHYATIGSSQIKKLGQNSFADPYIFHCRSYNSTARAIGRDWEEYFKSLPGDHYAHLGFYFSDLIEQKTAYSRLLPWICATPDFIGMVSEQARGFEFPAVIEIKSTKNEVTFRNTVSVNRAQVETAIDCFGVQVGFLITYLIDERGNLLDERLDRLPNPNFLRNNKKRLTKLYAIFLRKSIFLITNQILSLEELIEDLDRIPSKSTPEVNMDKLRTSPSHTPRPKCAYHPRCTYQAQKLFPKPVAEQPVIEMQASERINLIRLLNK